MAAQVKKEGGGFDLSRFRTKVPVDNPTIKLLFTINKSLTDLNHKAVCTHCKAMVTANNYSGNAMRSHTLACQPEQYMFAVMVHVLKEAEMPKPVSIAALWGGDKKWSHAKKKKALELMAFISAYDMKEFSAFDDKHAMSILVTFLTNGDLGAVTRDTLKPHMTSLDQRSSLNMFKKMFYAASVAFTVDGWSQGWLSAVAYTAHWVDTQTTVWRLESGVARVSELKGSHNAGALNEDLEKCVDSCTEHIEAANEWSLEELRKRAFAVTADGASPQRASVEQLNEDFSAWVLWCFCHQLHLCVKSAFTDVPEVEALMKKMSAIGASIKGSPLQFEQLSSIRKEEDKTVLQAKIGMLTRWTSHNEMLKRMVELSAEIKIQQVRNKLKDVSAQAQLKRLQRKMYVRAGFHEEVIDAVFANANGDADKTLYDSDIYTADFLQVPLEHLANVSKMLSGSKYATLGLVLPHLFSLHATLKGVEATWEAALPQCGVGTQASMKIAIRFSEAVRTRLYSRIQHDVFKVQDNNADGVSANYHMKPYLVAAYLHPFFKKLKFIPDKKLRAEALEWAERYLKEDMIEMRERTFVPEFARTEAAAVVPEKAARPPARKKKKEAGGGAVNVTAGAIAHSDSDEDSGNDESDLDTAVNQQLAEYRSFSFPDIDSMVLKDPELVDEWRKFLIKNLALRTLLTRVAVGYMATPASSAPVERVWSVATATRSKRRSSMTGTTFATSVRLKGNAEHTGDPDITAFVADRKRKREEEDSRK